MLVRQGKIALFRYHTGRLFAGINQLNFELPAFVTAERLEADILDTVKKNGLEALCRVRLQVFAGGGGLYGNEVTKSGYLIECFPLSEEATQYNEHGLVIGIAEGLAKSTDSLSNLKSCNALVYAMAARQAKGNKWNDALLLNTIGNVIESTIANIFWVKGGVVFTPPLTEGCIAGVMRRYIMDKLPHIVQQPLTIHAVMDADEIFLTNAIKRVKWVGVAGSRKYSNKMSASLLDL